MLNANEVASVIVERSHSQVLDPMSLQKLLYYTQAWHLAVTGERLFSEQIKAWADGPVVPQVWHERKSDLTRRRANQHTEDVVLSDLAAGIVDLVVNTYGWMGPAELSSLTHSELPWIEARGDTPAGERSTAAIHVHTIAEFYRNERTLGGRTAADLAAGGVYLLSNQDASPVNVRKLLAEMDDVSVEADPWGGANLSAAPACAAC